MKDSSHLAGAAEERREKQHSHGGPGDHQQAQNIPQVNKVSLWRPGRVGTGEVGFGRPTSRGAPAALQPGKVNLRPGGGGHSTCARAAELCPPQLCSLALKTRLGHLDFVMLPCKTCSAVLRRCRCQFWRLAGPQSLGRQACQSELLALQPNVRDAKNVLGPKTPR